MRATGESWEQIAAHVGRSKTHGYNRLRQGVTWTEADEWAVAYRLLPYEVWPEWQDADPATWCDLGPDFPPEAPAHSAGGIAA